MAMLHPLRSPSSPGFRRGNRVSSQIFAAEPNPPPSLSLSFTTRSLAVFPSPPPLSPSCVCLIFMYAWTVLLLLPERGEMDMAWMDGIGRESEGTSKGAVHSLSDTA